MSPLFPERLHIGLAPHELTVAACRGFMGKTVTAQKTLACDPAFGPQPWHGALEALKQLDRKACATVILSNYFVRYAIVPWSDALGGAAEEEAYVRHHFARIHGERARSWALRWSESGGTRLASAVDRELVEELKRTLPGLVSLQPYLMAAINRWGKSIPRGGAWLALVEPGRACIALHAGGRWRSVQNARDEWLALLGRERHCIDGVVPDLALVAGASPEPVPGWRFRGLNGGLAH